MQGFTDQGKRTQEFLEIFLVGKELTSDGVVCKTTTDKKNKINIMAIDMPRTDVYKLELYMKENNKDILSGIITVRHSIDDYERIVEPFKQSNVQLMNKDYHNGYLMLFFSKAKEFKKILNILKKFL